MNILAILLALATVAVCTNAEFELTDATNDDFADFLVKIMRKYGTWLRSNGLDPSPIIHDTVNFPSKNLKYSPELGRINCTIWDHYVTGHSITKSNAYWTESNLTEHYLAISQVVENPLHFTFKFECSGSVIAPNSTVQKPFNGQGNYTLRLSKLTDKEMLRRFGTTADLGFDFNSSRSKYKWSSIMSESGEVFGDWDNTDILKHMYYVREYFHSSHREHMVDDEPHLNPYRNLLVRYLKETLSNVNLKDITSTISPMTTNCTCKTS